MKDVEEHRPTRPRSLKEDVISIEYVILIRKSHFWFKSQQYKEKKRPVYPLGYGRQYRILVCIKYGEYFNNNDSVGFVEKYMRSYNIYVYRN